jgi:predicted Zn-ribbon and HTH transcriptional regulator
MKKYQCLECNCRFRVHYYEEYPGNPQRCPNCKSEYVERIDDDHAVDEAVMNEKEKFSKLNMLKGWQA